MNLEKNNLTARQGPLRIGSLFTGYGGLDMAVEAVFGGELEWYSEIEPAACKILREHTSPDVPNLGDITKIDWSTVEPVDILTGGYPCQPFSTAGLRKGTNDERHLWPYVKEAIRHLQPRLVILENVRGHLSLGFDIVLGEMASVGYDARWGIVRASDAGACHHRARLFILAYPNSLTFGQLRTGRMVEEECGNNENCGCGENISIRFSSKNNVDEIGSNENATNPGGEGFQGRSVESGSVEPSTGIGGHSATMGGEEIPTKTESNEQRESTRLDEVRAELGHGSDAGTVRLEWGEYEPAIRRWEQLTRPAPNPTIQRDNRPRLNPVFVEWMMGLPEGHVTGRGLRAAQELKMLGNGVVPQQAELAIRTLLEMDHHV